MEQLKKYRVWMHIRGSIVKPSYDGYADVWAENEQEAGNRAIREVRHNAHWDSSPDDFRIERVECRGAS